MGFAECLSAGEFPVSLEITPPRTPRRSVLLRRAALLGPAADAVNVIERQDRQSSLEASIDLLAAGIDPVWHLAVRGRSEAGVIADIRKAAAAGLRQVLCVLGDRAVASDERGPRVRDAIAIARHESSGLLIGATLNQYVDSDGAALRNLVGKIDAGAGYVQTQPVFDLARVVETVEMVKVSHPAVHVVPMVMPLLDPLHAETIGRRLGIALPAGLVDRIAEGPETAWNAFEETVAALRDRSDLFAGVAVMTFETDPEPAVGARIVAALRRAGIVRQ